MFVPILVTCLVASAWGTSNTTEHLTWEDFHILHPDSSHPLGHLDHNRTCFDASQSRTICTICKYVMRFIKKELGENTTKEIIREGLLTVCSKIPKFVEKGCDYLVDEFTEEIIPLIVINMSPKLICQKIRLCKKTFDLEIYRGVNTYSNDMPQVSSACAICKYLKMIVGEEKMKGKKADQINDALEKTCFNLPQTLQYECMSMAFIIESIPVLIPPFEVCQTICFAVPDEPSTHLAPSSHCGVAPFKSIPCDSCLTIMTILKSALEGVPEFLIPPLLDVLCVDTGPLAPFCIIIVTASATIIAHLIAEGASAEAICNAISLC